jgi:hypothetical protein
MTTRFSQYVFSPWLTPVRLVSTSNIAGTYYNGPNNNGVGATLTIAASSLTVDSVVAQVGDRILLQTQTNTNEQGIYIVDSITSTVVLKRAEDEQSLEQLKAGEYVSVGAGSVNAGNFYTLIEPLPQNLGIDAMIFNADPSAGGVSFSGPASTADALAVFSDTAGNLKAQSTASTLGFGLTISTGNFAVSAGTITSSGAIQATAGDVTAGSSTHAAKFVSFPASATNGTLILQALNAGGAFNTTIRNSVMGQSSVISIPDPGAATANFLLDTGTAAVLAVNNLKYGATPVAQVDPGSCTITAAAGASNTATVTVQLKDGSGTNMARIIPFRVYASSAADGLTLASAASTGFSVASGGISLNNGAAITTQISCMSSATGGCVLSLLDTAKQTSYLVLVLANGCKISAQLSSGSYGA